MSRLHAVMKNPKISDTVDAVKTIIITVGAELTSGHTINTNAAWMAKALEPLGLTPERVLTLRDDVAVLAREIRSAVKTHDIILITGGLGPTHDDVTKAALVKAFKTRLVRDGGALAGVRRFFRGIDRPMAPVNEEQADVPEGFDVIRNRYGTAPCLYKEAGKASLFALPGVPFEMKKLMKTEVIPRLKKRVSTGFMARTTLRTVGIGESALYTLVEESGVVDDNVELAYLPYFGQVDIRLSATGETSAAARRAVRSVARKLDRVVGQYVFGRDEQTLEEVTGEILVSRGMKLASAESCSGGLFASRITSVSGASGYFLEGVVAYSNQAKVKRLKVKQSTLDRYGAVSAQTAAQMARGVCATSGADIGLSSTGVAGPGGGTKEKPVGLVYIGLCCNGAVETMELNLGMDRNRNQQRTSSEMLAWLWRVARDL